MKTLITCILLLTCNSLKAQGKEIRYDNQSFETLGKYDSYLASDGAVYKIGDKITLARPSVECAQSYSFIFSPESRLPASFSGMQVEIIKIRAEGNERKGYSVTLYVEGIGFTGFYEIDMERAVLTGEIDCFGMTEQKALARLRKAKEKLDLELIGKEEYDALKNKLAEYIK